MKILSCELALITMQSLPVDILTLLGTVIHRFAARAYSRGPDRAATATLTTKARLAHISLLAGQVRKGERT